MDIKVKEKMDAVKKARVELSKAVKEAYPVGSVVTVKLGKSIVDIQITGYGPDWLAPDELRGDNIKTGKDRSFSCRYIVEDNKK